MSKCDLDVRLAEPERVYLPGEVVSGEVLVRVSEPCPCRGLIVSFGWRTHGRGNRAEGEAAKETLFTGEWVAGEERRYPFRFTTPNGPATYRGTVLNVDHYVTARADVPWALDPKAEAEVLLAPGEPRSYLYGPSYTLPEQQLAVQDKGRKGAAGCGTVIAGFGLLSLLSSIGFLVAGWVSNGRPTDPAALLAMVGAGLIGFSFNLVCLAAGLGLLAYAFWRALAQKKLGQPEVSLEPSVVRRGQRMALRISVSVPRRVTVTGASAEFSGLEEVVSGSGTNRSTHTHPLHSRSHALLSTERTLEPGERLDLATWIEVPEDAAITFAASDNTIKWSVKLGLAIKSWPDWSLDHPITVAP